MSAGRRIDMLPGTSSGPGFSTRLNYQAMVANGVMVLKDHTRGLTGPLLAGYWYDGSDHESAGDEELEDLVRTANRALRRFATGWMLHFQVIRRAEHAYELGRFREAVDQLIDEERWASGRYWRMDAAVFLTYTPSLFEGGEARKFKAFVSGEDAEDIRVVLDRRVQEFEAQLGEFERSFGARFRLRRMRHREGHDELLQALHYVLNGKWQARVRLPESPVYLDTLLARELLLARDELVHGEDYVACVGITELPATATPGLLNALREVNVDYRISWRFIFLDQHVAQRKLERLESKWAQLTELLVKMRLAGSVDRHAEERANEVSYALKDLNAGEIRFGHFTFNVVLRGATQSQADQKARVVMDVLEGLGFMPVLERKNRMEAFLGSLPGHGKQNLRLPLINTVNLGMLLDLDQAWPGEKHLRNRMMPAGSPALMRVRNWHGGSFDLHLHQRDVGHTIILGSTGAGKTVLVAHLCSQVMRYPTAQVIAFDHGAGLLPLTLGRTDGAFYALGEEGGPQLCPLAELETKEDLHWAEQWVSVLCEEQGVKVTQRETKRIRAALQELAAIPKELGTGRRLTDLLPHLQDDALESAVEYYAKGVGSQVLNGPQTTVRYGRFTTFEVAKLLTLDAKIVNPTLLYLFRQVTKRLDGRFTLIQIAEAWAKLNHPRFFPFIEELLNTARKKNAFVVLDSQQPAQIARSPIADVVFSACPTRIVLASETTDTIRTLYMEKLGLTSLQVDDVHRLGEGQRDPGAERWFLFKQGSRSRWCTLGTLGPAAQAFLASGSQPELAAVLQLARTHGEQWPEQWLLRRHARVEAARMRALRAERTLGELAAAGHEQWEGV